MSTKEDREKRDDNRDLIISTEEKHGELVADLSLISNAMGDLVEDIEEFASDSAKARALPISRNLAKLAKIRESMVQVLSDIGAL